MFFDGIVRTCVRFQKTKARSAAGRKDAMRCAKYEPASKVGRYPACTTLKDGGRSQWALRPNKCIRKKKKKKVAAPAKAAPVKAAPAEAAPAKAASKKAAKKAKK
jgi:predicted RNA-binding protein YlxR (DUF448 family)